MRVSRRELLRRLGGLGALAGLFGGSRIVFAERRSPQTLAGEDLHISAERARRSSAGEANSGLGLSPDSSTKEASRSSDSSAGADTSSTTGGDTSTSSSGRSGDHAHSGDHDDETTTTDRVAGQSEIELSGSVGPLTVSRGVVATIVGNVSLAGDLLVEGTLNGVDSFELDGSGFQIMAQNGGKIHLVGRPKTGWARVGDGVSGWSNGDRVAVAPMAKGDYTPKVKAWGGSWGSIGAPSGVKLLDGRVMHAEVANLTRSITIRNVARIMFHAGAGPAELRHIAVVDSGQSPLGFYPIHFHLNGSSVAGTVVEGVVVEGGRNRAFVPHGSHGIKLRDCVAFDTTKRPFWWDEGAGNETHDVIYDKCLAMLVRQGPEKEEQYRLAGFQLGRVRRGSVVDCSVVAVHGRDDSGGYWWPSDPNLDDWDFRRNVSHNNVGHGFIVWQNTNTSNVLQDSVAFRNSRAGADHGAYANNYRYVNMVLQENGDGVAVSLHANARDGGLTFSNLLTDGLLYVDDHSQEPSAKHLHQRATYTGVVYREKDKHPSHQEFEDCGLGQGDFDLDGIHPDSTIVVREGGELVGQWSGGSWS